MTTSAQCHTIVIASNPGQIFNPNSLRPLTLDVSHAALFKFKLFKALNFTDTSQLLLKQSPHMPLSVIYRIAHKFCGFLIWRIGGFGKDRQFKSAK